MRTHSNGQTLAPVLIGHRKTMMIFLMCFHPIFPPRTPGQDIYMVHGSSCLARMWLERSMFFQLPVFLKSVYKQKTMQGNSE